MHRKVAAALVAALVLAVAGCGGSEETLSRAELVRRIETACREGQSAGARKAREIRGSDSRQAFVVALLTGQKAEMDALDNVNASGAAKADYEAFKEGMQSRIAALERVSSAARADLQRTMAEVQPTAEAATRRIAVVFRRLGVEGCQ